MEVKLTLPNVLSASRILALPILFTLLFLEYYMPFLIIYILAASTDYFDGLAARRMNLVSHFGKELDSLADLLFYLSSAYFLYVLQVQAITANMTLLMIFFSQLAFSFLLSFALFRRPVMMHTLLLRLCAVLVFGAVVGSFFFDVTLFVRLIIITYIVAFTEEILIFLFYGNVNPDTRSIFHLRGLSRSSSS